MAIPIAAHDAKNKRWLVAVPFDDVYTVMEVVRILGQPATMVYSYINKGKLPAYKIDGVLHVKHDDLVGFIKRHKRFTASLNAKIRPPEKVVPSGKGVAPSPRTDFSIPLGYADLVE